MQVKPAYIYIFFYRHFNSAGVVSFSVSLVSFSSQHSVQEVQTAKARKLVLPILEAHQEDEKYSLIIHQTNTRKQKFYCNFTSFSLLWYIWQYNQNSRIWISLGGIQNIQLIKDANVSLIYSKRSWSEEQNKKFEFKRHDTPRPLKHKILIETKKRPDFLMLLLFNITSVFREARNIHTRESKRATTRLCGSLPHVLLL